ncbi:ATP synthase mitochondrial F1 complex assembly factor 2 isoform X2 [Dasypus novemcinctus]|uniref:ATP synthase mitochondrial F1 complex assembly factor 2 isoform X2 n=1 Tax=Dasypus novemcinctus TaxID=9361 RepID=UPI00265E31CB|nr:ATP synthase mitochondrial F1 complex assembly factor 2 isoform X2 [Dasypus novemcinctus]
MHLTTLCNTALDNPTQRDKDQLIRAAVKFLDTDTICYRVEEPETLVELQKNEWDPVIEWAKKRSRSGATSSGPMTMSCRSCGPARPPAPSLSTSAPRAPQSSTSCCGSDRGRAAHARRDRATQPRLPDPTPPAPAWLGLCPEPALGAGGCLEAVPVPPRHPSPGLQGEPWSRGFVLTFVLVNLYAWVGPALLGPRGPSRSPQGETASLTCSGHADTLPSAALGWEPPAAGNHPVGRQLCAFSSPPLEAFPLLVFTK